MFDTVECPYCEHENDMSDGLIDLPSDNTFDHICEECEKEFEVFVEFEPNYSGSKIIYEKCEKCGTKTRDFAKRGKIFPYPKSVKENIVCKPCFYKGHKYDYDNE